MSATISTAGRRCGDQNDPALSGIDPHDPPKKFILRGARRRARPETGHNPPSKSGPGRGRREEPPPPIPGRCRGPTGGRGSPAAAGVLRVKARRTVDAAETLARFRPLRSARASAIVTKMAVAAGVLAVDTLTGWSGETGGTLDRRRWR